LTGDTYFVEQIFQRLRISVSPFASLSHSSQTISPFKDHSTLKIPPDRHLPNNGAQKQSTLPHTLKTNYK